MIDTILKNIEQIPLLPQNIQRLMAILNDPMASTAELVRIVENDPALAVQSLYLCNSAYYSLPVQVTSVSHAVRFLGMDTVSGIAMAAYFQSLLPSQGKLPAAFWLKGLKDHLIASAQISETLAKAAGGAMAPATLFTAGLLHDVGKLAFSKLDPKIATAVYDHIIHSGGSLIQAEREILGTDHAAVGWQLAIRWKLPEVLMDAIRYHHDPFAGEYNQTFYVFIANQIANTGYDQSRWDSLLGSPELSLALKEIDLTTEQIMGLLQAWAMRRQIAD